MANKDGEGITIYFEGNTVAFDNSVDGMKKALKMLKTMTKTYMNEFQRTGDIEKYKQAIQSLGKEQEAAAKKAQLWADYVGSKKIGSDEWKNGLLQWANARKELTAIQLKLIGAEEDLKRFTSPDKVQKLANSFDDLGNRLENVGEIAGNIAQTFERVSRIAQDGLKKAAQAAIDYENAFADVKKTLSLTDEELEREDEIFADISDGLRELAKTVPTSANELAQIAGLAGQMGVGANDIVMFTQAMVDFGNATDITATDATQQIAQIYNVIGKGGDYSTLNSLLSTIVDLGNNSATTEKAIVEMMKNIAASASRVGMTEEQMAALAATLSSLGLDKGGASAISTLMTKIDMAVSTNAGTLKDWAKAAGTSVKDFKKMWGEDAAGALATMLDNLKKTADEGGNLNQVFDDLNIKEMRRVDTMGRLVNASDVYRDSLDRANTAFDDGTALSEEASKRYETTASKIQIMKNNFMEFAMTIGELFLPIINKLVEFGTQIATILNNLSPAMQILITTVTAIIAVVAPLAAGIALVTTKLAPMFKALSTLVINSTAAAKILGALKGAFAFLTGPIGAVLALLGLVIATDDTLSSSMGNLAKTAGGALASAFSAVVSIVKYLLEFIGAMIEAFGILWEKFKDTTAGQIFITTLYGVIEVVNFLLGLIEKLFGWISKLFGGLSDSLREARNLESTIGQINNGGGLGGSGGRQFIGLDSAGYMSGGMMATGMTFNNTFTITGINNIDQATANRLADMMTDRMNENLGRRYA